MQVINSRRMAQKYERMSEQEKNEDFKKIRYFIAQNVVVPQDKNTKRDVTYYTTRSMYRGVKVIAGPAADKKLRVISMLEENYESYREFNEKANFLEGFKTQGDTQGNSQINAEGNLQAMYAVMTDETANMYEAELAKKLKIKTKAKTEEPEL